MIEVGSYWKCNLSDIIYIVLEKYKPNIYINEGAFIVEQVDCVYQFVLLEKYFYSFTKLTPLEVELL